MTQTNASPGSCRSASPAAVTGGGELDEVGGSLHGAPAVLQVDGRRLSPPHGSRSRLPELLPDGSGQSRAQEGFLRAPRSRRHLPLPAEEGGSGLG